MIGSEVMDRNSLVLTTKNDDYFVENIFNESLEKQIKSSAKNSIEPSTPATAKALRPPAKLKARLLVSKSTNKLPPIDD